MEIGRIIAQRIRSMPHIQMIKKKKVVKTKPKGGRRRA